MDDYLRLPALPDRDLGFAGFAVESRAFGLVLNELAQQIDPSNEGRALELLARYGSSIMTWARDQYSLTDEDAAKAAGEAFVTLSATPHAVRVFARAVREGETSTALSLLTQSFERLPSWYRTRSSALDPGDASPGADNSAQRVAFRIADVRDRRGMTLAELTDRLREIGYGMSISVLSKIENGQRRVTVEDLLALSMALDCSPNWLLLPPEANEESHVVVGDRVWTSHEAWRWALADKPVMPESSDAIGFDFFIANGPDQHTMRVSWWIALHLQQLGCRVFHERMIRWGDPWDDVLDRAFRSSDNVLVLVDRRFSPKAPMYRPLLSREARSKRIIPVWLDPASRVEAHAHFNLGRVKGVDLAGLDSTEAEKEVGRLVELVARPRLDTRHIPPFPGAAPEQE